MRHDILCISVLLVCLLGSYFCRQLTLQRTLRIKTPSCITTSKQIWHLHLKAQKSSQLPKNTRKASRPTSFSLLKYFLKVSYLVLSTFWRLLLSLLKENNDTVILWHCTKKWSFSLRISLVNVTKSTGNRGFGHIYWRNPEWKTLFLCSVITLFWFHKLTTSLY